jgi:hypothetical protein
MKIYAGKMRLIGGRVIHWRVKVLNRGEKLKNPKADAKPALAELVQTLDKNKQEAA